MTRGTQADLGGLRVDRPIWDSPDGLAAGVVRTPDDPAEVERKRLPRMRPYAHESSAGASRARLAPAPDPDVAAPERPLDRLPDPRPPVDVDLTVPDPARRPVDVDLTASDPARRSVDVDLTVPDPWKARSDPPAYRSHDQDVGDLLRAEHVTGSPYRVPRKHSGRRNRWVDRKIRHAHRRLRRPTRAPKLERHVTVMAVGAAMLAVVCTLAIGVRSKVSNNAEFVEMSAELHREPQVADALSRNLANAMANSEMIAPERALDVKLVIEDVIADDEFEPIWRNALVASHAEAFQGKKRAPLFLGEAVPGLAERLEERRLASANSVEGAPLSVVQDGYVTELTALRKVLDSIVFMGVPLFAVITIFTLYRTRNRFRVAGLIAAGTLVGALVMLAFGPRLAPLAVSMIVAERAQPLAEAALSGVMPSVRLLQFGLAIVALTLLVASRMEEVRLTPFVPSTAKRSRRRRRKNGAGHEAGDAPAGGAGRSRGSLVARLTSAARTG